MFDPIAMIKNVAVVIGLPALDGDDDNGRDPQLASLPRLLRIALRLKNNIERHQVGLLAAGIAFYFLLAAFPAIAAMVSVSVLLADTDVLMEHLYLLDQFLPAEAATILSNQVRSLASANNSAHGLSFLISFMVTFYAASKGVRVLIRGFNVAFGYRENRNIIWRTLLAYGITVGAIVYMIVSLVLVAGIPTVLAALPYVADYLNTAYLALRWPILFGIALFGLQMVYNLGPAAPKGKWRFMSWGALAATVAWVGASAGFSFFVTHFGNYNEVYGSLSAVIILLMWFWISAMSILGGAELNAAIDWDNDLNP